PPGRWARARRTRRAGAGRLGPARVSWLRGRSGLRGQGRPGSAGGVVVLDPGSDPGPGGCPGREVPGAPQLDSTVECQASMTTLSGVVNCVLANLFMHYVLDKWLEREYP